MTRLEIKMTLMQKFTAWLRPQGFGATRPEDPSRSISYLPLPVYAAGLNLTMDVATQLSVVWACMDAITKAIVCSRWKAYETNQRKRDYLPEDPVTWLLNVRPNPEMTAIAWREAMLYQALSWGNSYSEIVPTGSGKVAELWPLRSDRMVVGRRSSDGDRPGELVYRYYNWSGGFTDLRPSEVLHFRGPSIDGLMGDNMVARSARTIALAIAQERFASSFYGNNAVMGTVLEYPKTLSPESHKRLKEDWSDKHTGPDKAHRPFILEGGMKMIEQTHDVTKVMPVENRSFSVEEICRFWGVPPHKVQHLARATFNNIEHLGIEFVRDALTPWANRMQQEVDFKLYPQRAPWRDTRLDTEWLTFGDAKSRAEAYQIYRRVGVYSANDIREKEGMNTIGAEGDVRIVESNMVPLKQLMNNAKKPEIFQYHITAGIPTVNEVRERLELPPREGGDAPANMVGGVPGEGEPPKPGEPASPDEEMAAEDEETVAEDEETAPPRKQSARAELAVALTTLLTGTLTRYRRRLENRETDLRRKRSRGEPEIAQALATLAAEQRETVLAEAQESFTILERVTGLKVESSTAIQLADAVDNGEDPSRVAAVFVDRHLKA